MDNNNSVVVGKINKKKCYLNNGKYGHYITYDTKNYKVPEWFPVHKMDIDVAESGAGLPHHLAHDTSAAGGVGFIDLLRPLLPAAGSRARAQEAAHTPNRRGPFRPWIFWIG